MLQSLSIKNLALIKNENIEFNNGLNIILGETGAGKSLIFEALFFVLGLKTDKSLLRTGEDNMRVDVLFSNLSSSIKVELENLEIENQEELLISRSLNLEGRSSIKINGNIATLATLKIISKALVDTLVQHEGLELLKTKNHLIMLDSYIGEKAYNLKNKIKDILVEINRIEKDIDNLGGDSIERERRKDVLLFQINEIESAELQIGEDEEINDKLQFLSSAEKIKETVSHILSLLSNDGNGAISKINEAYKCLNNVSNIEKINLLQERIKNSSYEIEDVFDELHNIFLSSNFDEIEYNRLDQRRDQLKSLKKKYGTSIEDVLEYYKRIKDQYDELSNSEIIIEKLIKQKDTLYIEANKLAKELSTLRKEKAEEVKKKIVLELKDLGMKGTIFEVSIQEKSLSSDGVDNIIFNFSANEGQEVKNISKTASGGEISRIMLAIKNVFKGGDSTKTLIFDEVDSGISGETGNMVASKLRLISKEEQILCITHLPQVASAGHSFIKVEKTVSGGNTISNSYTLKENEVPKEIAKLIAGKTITENALKHAQELRNKFTGE